MKNKDVYSAYKIVHHEDKIKQLRKGEMITPLFAQVDLTNSCNLNCNFCSYKIGNYSPDHMKDFNKRDRLDKNLVFKILEDMKQSGVKAVEWTGGGEPSLHPDYKDFFKFAKELNYEQALVTNSTLLDDEGIDIIRDFSWVRFSVDASAEKTYKKIKGQYGLNKTLGNLEKLIASKNPENIAGFSFIVCRDNYKEIYGATRLAKDIGCDNIRFSLAYTPEGRKMFGGIWEDVVKEIEKAKQKETKDFKVFTFSNRINEISQKTKSDACYFHEFVAAIGANGGIYPCCLLKYDSRFNFGNLNEKSFEEIWFGEERKKFTEKIRKGCNYSCWMTEKNNFISYLLKDNPQHINFI